MTKLRIRELREGKKWSPQELSKKLGVSKNTVIRRETKDVQLKLSVLKAIAELFDVSIDFLVGREK